VQRKGLGLRQATGPATETGPPVRWHWGNAARHWGVIILFSDLNVNVFPSVIESVVWHWILRMTVWIYGSESCLPENGSSHESWAV